MDIPHELQYYTDLVFCFGMLGLFIPCIIKTFQQKLFYCCFLSLASLISGTLYLQMCCERHTGYQGKLIHFECFNKFAKLWFVSRMGCAIYVVSSTFWNKIQQNTHDCTKIEQSLFILNFILLLHFYVLSYAEQGLWGLFTALYIIILFIVILKNANLSERINQKLFIILFVKYSWALILGQLAEISMYFYFASNFIYILIFMQKILSIDEEVKIREKHV